ncbi:MAG: CHAT domain-containing protein [Acidobacteriota bacterium]
MPAVHLDFAKAYFNLNKAEKSLDHLEKSLAIAEEIQASGNSNLSLGILETYHNAYRLLTQIKAGNPQESMELADSTTVISAQWEADDKSTSIFTKTSNQFYEQGILSAEAMQKAALELIKNKSDNMYEAYCWADFTLNGDFR